LKFEKVSWSPLSSTHQQLTSTNVGIIDHHKLVGVIVPIICHILLRNSYDGVLLMNFKHAMRSSSFFWFNSISLKRLKTKFITFTSNIQNGEKWMTTTFQLEYVTSRQIHSFMCWSIPHIPTWEFSTNKVFADLVRSVAIIGKVFCYAFFLWKTDTWKYSLIICVPYEGTWSIMDTTVK